MSAPTPYDWTALPTSEFPMRRQQRRFLGLDELLLELAACARGSVARRGEDSEEARGETVRGDGEA